MPSLLETLEMVAQGRGEPIVADALYRCLSQSVLLVAVEGTALVDGNSKTASLARLGNSKGESALLAFSDRERMDRWRRGAPAVELRGQELFEKAMTLNVDFIVINISGPVHAQVAREAFINVARGAAGVPGTHDQLPIPQQTTLFYKQVTGAIATELQGKLRLALLAFDSVADAYLLEQRGEKIQYNGILLAVEFKSNVSGEEKHKLISALGKIGSATIPRGECFFVQELSDHLKRSLPPKSISLLAL